MVSEQESDGRRWAWIGEKRVSSKALMSTILVNVCKSLFDRDVRCQSISLETFSQFLRFKGPNAAAE